MTAELENSLILKPTATAVESAFCPFLGLINGVLKYISALLNDTGKSLGKKMLETRIIEMIQQITNPMLDYQGNAATSKIVEGSSTSSSESSMITCDRDSGSRLVVMCLKILGQK